MILFDYGNTILHEPGYSTLNGERALARHYRRNKNNLTPEEVNAFSEGLFQELLAVKHMNLDFHERQFQRLLYEYLEIELDIPYADAERIFWDNASFGAVMPGADRVLDYIKSRGIRSGVISNLSFSGAALAERINRLLPDNAFEFVLASSEYILRKPDRRLFELALKKAGLAADQVWFCGDTIKADIRGASGAGIFPVWYENLEIENPWSHNEGLSPECEHLHIHQWDALIEVLEGLG